MNNSYLILTLKTPEQKKNSLCFLQKQNRIVGKFWNTSIIPATKRNYEFTQVARHNLAFHVWSLNI